MATRGLENPSYQYPGPENAGVSSWINQNLELCSNIWKQLKADEYRYFINAIRDPSPLSVHQLCQYNPEYRKFNLKLSEGQAESTSNLLFSEENNFQLDPDTGIILGFIGPSGCGKSTLMKLLLDNPNLRQNSVGLYQTIAARDEDLNKVDEKDGDKILIWKDPTIKGTRTFHYIFVKQSDFKKLEDIYVNGRSYLMERSTDQRYKNMYGSPRFDFQRLLEQRHAIILVNLSREGIEHLDQEMHSDPVFKQYKMISERLLPLPKLPLFQILQNIKSRPSNEHVTRMAEAIRRIYHAPTFATAIVEMAWGEGPILKQINSDVIIDYLCLRRPDIACQRT